MAQVKTPACMKWRDGRPRWEPSPTRRAQGWKGRDLKDDAGDWLDFAAACVAAEAINIEVRGGTARQVRTRAAPARKTMNALWARYTKSSHYEDLREKTRNDYRKKFAAFAETFGEHLAAAVTKPHVHAWYERARKERGLTMAHGTVRVASVVFGYAELIGWRPENSNPCSRLKMKTPEGRLVMWEPEEVTAIVDAADAMGLHSVGTAFVLAIHSGQRQGDVLALDCALFEPERRTRMVTQSKTSANVAIWLTEEAEARAAQERARLMSAGILPRGIFLRDPATGEAWKEDRFRKQFAKVRARAQKTEPSVAGKRFLDTRDTAVTRLALAGAKLYQIMAVTGHSPQSINVIMRSYLALSSPMARAARDQLQHWLRAEGIAL